MWDSLEKEYYCRGRFSSKIYAMNVVTVVQWQNSNHMCISGSSSCSCVHTKHTHTFFPWIFEELHTGHKYGWDKVTSDEVAVWAQIFVHDNLL